MKKMFAVFFLCAGLIFIPSSFASRFSDVCPAETRKSDDASKKWTKHALKVAAELKKMTQKIQDLQTQLDYFRTQLADLITREGEKWEGASEVQVCLDNKRREAEERCSQ